MAEEISKITEHRKEWEEKCLKPALLKFKFKEAPTRLYTPEDSKNNSFLEKVGFPGEYPFTAGAYPTYPYAAGTKGGGAIQSAPGLRRAGRYSGYGTPEDTRDYYKHMQSLGAKMGPNIAFDLPTQCGYDSDNSLVRGEIGKVGVAVDTLRDLDVVYEAFQGELNLDRIASNMTINAPANIIMGMYFAMAAKRGIPYEALKATPQNDILKEFIARGTYIFPPEHSMRMMRDSFVFYTKYAPQINVTSIGGIHIREAGASREQDLAFSMSIGMAYLKSGIEAGLDIDSFAPKFTFNAFGGSMELFKEVAFQRAARRLWARILKERFKAKDPRSMLLRCPIGAHIGLSAVTVQRALNNVSRAVVGGVAGALSGGPPNVAPPYDEALGLGWSLEAIQLCEDAGRILKYEARLTDVMDPLAGSYYVETLTDEIEESAIKEIEKIDAMGGAVAAIGNGYMYQAIAKSAYERQKRIEKGEDFVVGVNCFLDESELEVTTSKLVPHPYDPGKRQRAEEQQIINLTQVKKARNSREVSRLLKDLKVLAGKKEENLFPHFIECANAYVSLQEMCDVLREVFGEYTPVAL